MLSTSHASKEEQDGAVDGSSLAVEYESNGPNRGERSSLGHGLTELVVSGLPSTSVPGCVA